MREYTPTVRIHSTAAEKPASQLHVIFKGMSKKSPGLSKVYMETSQASGIQKGLMTFSSVTWAALTFRNLVQVHPDANLRSLSDSKYSLRNLSPALYYHPQNNSSWRGTLWRLFNFIEQRSSPFKGRMLLYLFPFYEYLVILLNMEIFIYRHIGTLVGAGRVVGFQGWGNGNAIITRSLYAVLFCHSP